MSCELLAPAGDFASLRAAVSAGADAVYIGAEKFSARANATNFGDEELKEAVRYCHIRGVKVYLAINTLIKNKEMNEALTIAKKAAEYGVDAYIVQDVGLILLLKENFDVPVHASTQMTVFDEHGLEFLNTLGIERAVLSRECPKEKIAALAEKQITELEVFCHGAICMSYSGQCLMSSMIGKRSANRGMCAQPCRLPYSIDGKKGYYLSPKDLCLADEVGFLKKKGVSSLKIEGRMKGPAYVASSVSAYRKALDGEKITKEDYDMLLKAFSRGQSFTKGCYGSVKGSEMMNVLSSNDNVLSSADKKFTKSLEAYWLEGSEKRKVPICGRLSVSDVTTYSVTDGENTAEAFTDTPVVPRGKKTDSEFAKIQLSKLGNTPYIMTDFQADFQVEAYFSASELNALRREATEKLSYMRIGERSSVPNFNIKMPQKQKSNESYICASVKNAEQAKALIKAGARVYVPCDTEYIEGAYGAVIPNVYSKLPDDIYYPVVLAGSIGGAEFAKKLKKSVIADMGMNIFNVFSASLFDKVTLSAELSLAECAEIAKYKACEAIVYGYIPVMTTANCVIRISGKCSGADCSKCKRSMMLKDRKGAELKVFAGNGINEIYNSVPIFTADKTEEIRRAGINGMRLNFTDESPEECVNIYLMYKGERKVELPPKYTRGHFYKSL